MRHDVRDALTASSTCSLVASYVGLSLGESGGVGLCTKPSFRRSFGFAQRRNGLSKSSPFEPGGVTIFIRPSLFTSFWFALCMCASWGSSSVSERSGVERILDERKVSGEDACGVFGWTEEGGLLIANPGELDGVPEDLFGFGVTLVRGA